MGWETAVCVALGGLALLMLAIEHGVLTTTLARPRPPPPIPAEYPSVTVIRPVRGLDVGAVENIRALLSLSYPGRWEVLFVVDSSSDPAYPVIETLCATTPTKAARVEVLIAGQPPPGRTGKLNAMMVGVAAAHGELLAFNDSDTRPAAGILQPLVAALLADKQAGASFAPIYASADRPNLGDAGYGLLVNAWYGSSVLSTAAADGAMPFIMGQLMVFRREALADIGGVGCAQGQFVDDMYLGRRLCAAGWKNVLVNVPLRVVTGQMGIADFLKTFRRWLLFSESGLSFRFTLPNWVRAIACWLAWMGLAFSIARSSALGAAACIAALGFAVYSQDVLQQRCHGPRLHLSDAWMAAVLPLLAAGVALSTRLTRTVQWRGRSYALDGGGRLGVIPAAPPSTLRT